MEKMGLYFRIALIFFLFGFNNILAGIPWSESAVVVTKESCTNSGNSTCMKFRILFTQITTNGVNYNAFHYLLVTGDGSFIEGRFQLDNNTTSAYVDLEHDYVNGRVSDPYLEVASTYNDGVPPKRFYVNNLDVTPNVGYLSQPKMNPDMDSQRSIRIFPFLTPRANEKITYVVSFRYLGLDDINRAYLKFDFPKDGSIIVEKVIAPGTVSNSTYLNTPNSTGQVNLQYVNVDASKTYNCFIQMQVGSNVNFGDVLLFEAALQSQVGDNLTDLVSTGEQVISLNSHDPNQIISNYEKGICLKNKPDTVTYRIDFQNIGKREANTVVVTNVLPKCYDIKTLNTIKPIGIQNDTNHFKVNTATRTITWILTGDYIRQGQAEFSKELKGTSDEKFGEIVFNEHTKDLIVYSVMFDKNIILPFCGSIINQAKIVFDANDPIFTNFSKIQIDCDLSCTPCEWQLPYPAEPFKMVVEENIPTVIDLVSILGDSITGSEFFWYPNTGIDNITSSAPKIKLSSDMVYDVVITKGCKSQLVRIKVQVNKTVPLPPDDLLSELICGIGSFLLLIIVVLFVISRRLKK